MAYGDNRTLVESDTFDSSIDTDWDNASNNLGSMEWVTGGYVQASAASTSSGMRHNAGTFSNDQYSKATVQAQGSSGTHYWLIAAVRMAAGATHTLYYGTAEANTQTYKVARILTGTETYLNSFSDSTNIPLSAGETITTEVVGTTLRFGSNSAGSDVEKVSTTDSNITSGRPGLLSFSSGDKTQIRYTSWEAGDIGTPPVNTVPAVGRASGVFTTSDTTTDISTGLSISDFGSGTVTSVALSCTSGDLTVTLSGDVAITAGANGSSALTLGTSTVNSEYNTVLGTLLYQGDAAFHGKDTIQIITTTDVDSDTTSWYVLNDPRTVTATFSGTYAQGQTAIGTVQVKLDTGESTEEITMTTTDLVSNTDVDAFLVNKEIDALTYKGVIQRRRRRRRRS